MDMFNFPISFVYSLLRLFLCHFYYGENGLQAHIISSGDAMNSGWGIKRTSVRIKRKSNSRRYRLRRRQQRWRPRWLHTKRNEWSVENNGRKYIFWPTTHMKVYRFIRLQLSLSLFFIEAPVMIIWSKRVAMRYVINATRVIQICI